MPLCVAELLTYFYLPLFALGKKNVPLARQKQVEITLEHMLLTWNSAESMVGCSWTRK